MQNSVGVSHSALQVSRLPFRSRHGLPLPINIALTSLCLLRELLQMHKRTSSDNANADHYEKQEVRSNKNFDEDVLISPLMIRTIVRPKSTRSEHFSNVDLVVYARRKEVNGGTQIRGELKFGEAKAVSFFGAAN